MSCTISSKKIQKAKKKTVLKISIKKQNKAKKYYAICESENYNQQRYNQKPNVNLDIESEGNIKESAEDIRKNNNDKSLLFLDTEST